MTISRRNFLKGFAVVGAAGLLAPEKKFFLPPPGGWPGRYIPPGTAYYDLQKKILVEGDANAAGYGEFTLMNNNTGDLYIAMTHTQIEWSGHAPGCDSKSCRNFGITEWKHGDNVLSVGEWVELKI